MLPSLPEAAQMPAGCLYRSRVMHLRRHPVRYRFFYRAFYLLLDIDRLAQTSARLRLFSHNRFNLLSFHDRDHGPCDGSALRPWLDALLRKETIDLDGGPVRLLCLPRILGYVFNPISIFYCEHRDGTLRVILCEVRNTFGDRHCYLLSRNGAPMDYATPHYKTKILHVSPLIGMGGEYRFRFTAPGEHFRVLIRLFQHRERRSELLMAATLDGERTALTDGSLLAQVARMPFMTLKIVAAIHWQAFKIWLRGASYFRRPAPPTQEVS